MAAAQERGKNFSPSSELFFFSLRGVGGYRLSFFSFFFTIWLERRDHLSPKPSLSISKKVYGKLLLYFFFFLDVVEIAGELFLDLPFLPLIPGVEKMEEGPLS